VINLFALLFFIVAAWLLLSYLLTGRSHLSAAILSLIVFINALISLFISDDFVYGLDFAIKYDGATALIMTMLMGIDKRAWKYALILAFAVLCHSMILLHLITGSYFMWAISKPFYLIYDELIIMSALLLLWVSRDGMAKGLNNASRLLQGVLSRFVFYNNRISKSLPPKEKRKGRT
jgi:hypothetical protein